jgi:Putative phage tail protein
MPVLAPIVTAISTAIVAVFPALPLAAAQAIVGLGLSIGAFIIQRLLTPRQKPPGQQFDVRIGANVPMFNIYGRQRVGGLIMPPVQTSNKVWHVRVLGISEHDALEAIIVDGRRCRFEGIEGQWTDAGGNRQNISGDFYTAWGELVFPNQSSSGASSGDAPTTPGLQSGGPNGSDWVNVVEFLRGPGNPRMRVKFYSGREDQVAEPVLYQNSQSDAQDRKHWTAQHHGRGVCYVIVEVQPDDKVKLTANPTIEFIVRGRKVWDPRKDPAYGGVGTHSRANKASWEWSDNVALCATDYRLGVRLGTTKVLGCGTPIGRIRMDSRMAAANACDAPRALLGGGTEPMWRIAAAVGNDRIHRDNLAIFYDAMAGSETERGGTYRLRAGGVESPVFAFTDADLVKGPRKFKSKRPRLDRRNGVTGKFADPLKNFELVDLPPRFSTADEIRDGGERRTSELTFSQVPSGTQGQHLMEIARRQSQLMATATVTLPPRARDPEIVDLVSWQSDRFTAGETFTYRIESWRKGRDLTLTWGLTQTSPFIWSWDPAVDQLDITTSADLPSAAPKLEKVAGFVVTSSSEVGANGQVYPVFICSWTPITDRSVEALVVRYRPVTTPPAEWASIRFAGEDLLAAGGPGKIIVQLAATPYEFEADLETLPRRPTIVEPVDPVVSGPALVVPTAREAQGIGPGGVNWEAINKSMRNALARIDEVAQQALEVAQKAAAATLAGGQQQFLELERQAESLKVTSEGLSASVENTRIVALGAAEAVALQLDEVKAKVDDNSAAVQTLTTSKIDASQASALAQQQLDAAFGGGSAGIKMRLAAQAGVTGSLAAWSIEASVTGAAGTYKSTGLTLVIWSDAGTIRSRIQFRADQTEFLTTGGTPFVAFDATTGALRAERFYLSSATTGARFEYTPVNIKSYDSNGVLRCRIGKRN